jgi:D-alanyl-D-alanine carboxypeptidase/D-alanyl-D-alanine-endopeptidase (penicillin-binding protein 4)
MYLSRRQILASLLISCAPQAWAETRPPKKIKAGPPASLKEIMAGYAPSGTHSIVVADAVTGRVLEASNANKPLPPASVAKALTTIYALQSLGSEWRFKTQLVASGSRITNRILQGDLTLVGGGDPALDTDGLAHLLEQLQARGIAGISGRFAVYSGALPYQRLLDRDQLEHVGYNPTISGMNLNYNRVFLEWKRSGEGHNFALSAKTKRFKPIVRGVSVRGVNRKEPIYKYANSGGRDQWTVSTQALGSQGNRWLPIRNPADYTGEVFVRLAADFGLSLPVHQTTKTAPKGAVLAQEESAPLNAVCRSMLKYSTNLTAEAVGLSASRKRGKKPKKVSESARAMSDWLKGRFGLRDIRLMDHSGLSDKSKVNASEMVRVLSRIGWNGPLRSLMKPIGLRNASWKISPIGGVEVMAKTGTLNFTSALAGYMETASGQRLVFAIFTVDQRARGAVPKSKRDRAPGAKKWARNSRIMQHQLLARWGRVY